MYWITFGLFCSVYLNFKGFILDYGGINRDSGNWLDFEYILKLMLVGFVDIFDMGCVGKRKFINVLKIWFENMSE